MIVENIHTQNQTHLGKLTPRAPQDRLSSAFAIRDGNCPTGWQTVDDMKHGVAFGERMEKRLQFREFKDGDKPHDVEFNGLKLREMVTERQYIEQKDRIEGAVSTRKREAIENAKSSSENGMTRTAGSDVTIYRQDTPVEAMQEAYGSDTNTPPPPPAAPKNRGGRPRKQPVQPVSSTPTT